MKDTAEPRAIRVAVGLARYRAGRYLVGGLFWIAWWSLPALVGLVLKAAFDAISGDAPAGLDAGSLIGVLLAVEAARLGIFFAAFPLWARWWAAGQALLRTNLLRSQVSSGGNGAGAPVRSAGAAIAVFRDDAEDFVKFVDSWVDLAGAVVFAIFALVVMVRIDAVLALVVGLPLVIVFAVTRALADRVRRTRRADREATARVTGFLGDVFSAVLAVKVAGAEERTVARLRQLNAARGRTALHDRVLADSLDAASGSTVDVGIGVVLLLAAGSMRAGEFTVGDLALFASYVSWLAGLPRIAGLVLTRHRHAEVAARRMAAMLPRNDETEAVVPRRLRLGAPVVIAERPRPHRPAPADVRLSGFGVRHAGGGGIRGVDLHLPAGSFTVVCGTVGGGKTTLLRGLLGLAGPAEGTVRWDGAVVDDLAAHMVPPNCAYVPQAPRLFSATLRQNLLLGRAAAPGEVGSALHTAAFDADVAAMTDGLETVIGPRGVRLSGGQLQRAAAARALVADAALLVLDDLSSALDAATEQRLWSRLLAPRPGAGSPPTVLVVSHRAAALAHADQVVVVEDGRVRAIGTLAALRADGIDPLGRAAAG